MKKLAVFCIVVVALILSSFLVQKQSVLDFDSVKAVSFVTDCESATKFNLDFVQNGSDAIAQVDVKQASELYQKIQPKCIVLSLDEKDLSKLTNFLNLKHFHQQNLGDMEIIYGYTDKFGDFTFVDNKKINVQIAVRQGDVVAGFPLIMTGF